MAASSGSANCGGAVIPSGYSTVRAWKRRRQVDADGPDEREEQQATAAHGERLGHLVAWAQGEAVGQAHAAVGGGVGEYELAVAEFFGIADQELFLPAGAFDFDPALAGVGVAEVEEPAGGLACGQSDGKPAFVIGGNGGRG